MSPPFLSVVTRTHSRPTGLRDAIGCLVSQTCYDFEHVILYDPCGDHPEGNILWANSQFYELRHKPRGAYVCALDDDGLIVALDFVEVARAVADAHDCPDVLLVRSFSTDYDGTPYTLPLPDVWSLDWELGERPAHWAGHGYNVIVRSDVWRAHVANYAHERGGDWHFITSLIKSGLSFVRLPDRYIPYSSLVRGKGQRFDSALPGWFESLMSRAGATDEGDNLWRIELWRRVQPITMLSTAR